jgi:site-specific recombinase XerD
LLLMFRRALRVSEACQLKVTDVNVKEKIIHIHQLSVCHKINVSIFVRN